MSSSIDSHRIRQAILETVSDQSRSGNIQTASVLGYSLDKLGMTRNKQNEQALLTIWHDLFRTGYLAWGIDFSNPNPPHCHVTEQGRGVLRNLTRDPANPDGYLNHLSQNAKVNPIAQSYLDEALRTYNSDCYKAAAVMVGTAAESMVLELKDALIERMELNQNKSIKELTDWRVKKVIDAIYQELTTHKSQMPRSLAETFEQYWPAFTGQIRNLRNDAGHPTNIESVTHENVQASLLIFPELAKLVYDLKTWVSNDYDVSN